MKSQPTDPFFVPSRSARKLSLAWSSTDGATTMPSPLFKVAFATADRISVNQHFGATLGFAIYAVDEKHARLVEVAEFPSDSLHNANPSMDSNESKLADKIAALAGCAAVYCLAVGASAVRQLVASGIQPVRMEDEIAIELLLIHLRKAIHDGGIAWIDRIVRHDGDSQRFDRMAEEGWQE